MGTTRGEEGEGGERDGGVSSGDLFNDGGGSIKIVEELRVRYLN